MKTLLLVLFLVLTPAAWAADCNDECASTSDCTTGSCPVCIGMCVDCRSLATQTECQETSTGASASCAWATNQGICRAVGEIPEMPSGARNFWLILLTVGLIFGAGYWVRRSTKTSQPR